MQLTCLSVMKLSSDYSLREEAVNTLSIGHWAHYAGVFVVLVQTVQCKFVWLFSDRFLGQLSLVSLSFLFFGILCVGKFVYACRCFFRFIATFSFCKFLVLNLYFYCVYDTMMCLSSQYCYVMLWLVKSLQIAWFAGAVLNQIWPRHRCAMYMCMYMSFGNFLIKCNENFLCTM